MNIIELHRDFSERYPYARSPEKKSRDALRANRQHHFGGRMGFGGCHASKVEQQGYYVFVPKGTP